MDIETVDAPRGYQYISSMAKLMAAWMASWGRCSPEALDGQETPGHEPDQQSGEDQFPDRTGTERPAAHEHAGHGHPHEEVGDVDVPSRRLAQGHRDHQQRGRGRRQPSHQDAEEVVQPGGGGQVAQVSLTAERPVGPRQVAFVRWSGASRMSASTMTGAPELGSVAPPARMPPT